MTKFKIEMDMPVCVVPVDQRERRTREHCTMFVTKIGRKWVECAYSKGGMSAHHRFDRADFEKSGKALFDAGGYPARNIAYADLAIYQREKAVSSLRHEIREQFDAYNLLKIPVEKLIQIAAVLEIKHEVPADK